MAKWIGTAALTCLMAAGCADRGMEHHAAPGALGPYSGSVRAGELIFVSGKIGERGGALERECETAIDAVEQELSASEALPRQGRRSGIGAARRGARGDPGDRPASLTPGE